MWKYNVRFEQMSEWKNNFTTGIALNQMGGKTQAIKNENGSSRDRFFILSSNPFVLFSIMYLRK